MAFPIIAYPSAPFLKSSKMESTDFLVHDVQGAVTALNEYRMIDRNACRRQFEERFTAKRMAPQEYLAIYERS